MANVGLFATNQFATKSETTDCEQAEGTFTWRRERETLTDKPLKKIHGHTVSPGGHFSLGSSFIDYANTLCHLSSASSCWNPGTPKVS